MMKSYTNVVFSPEFENETLEKRYRRLFNTLENKNKKLQLDAIRGCWNVTPSLIRREEKHLIIEILARLNIAFEKPNNEENLRQLSLLTQEIPQNELDFQVLKAVLIFTLSVALGLTIAILLKGDIPEPVPVLIAFSSIILGYMNLICQGEQISFKSHLKNVQKDVNKNLFFTSKGQIELIELPKIPNAVSLEV